MHVFLVDSELNNKTDHVSLLEEENHHATKVLRCKKGDEVLLLDGKGKSAIAIFQEVQAKQSSLLIQHIIEHNPLPYSLHVAIAPTKMIDRFEWFLEKATEIGVSEITPIITDRSERKVVKMQRMQKVILAAVKQSQQAYFPQINDVIKFKDFITQSKSSNKFIAHCADGDKKALINSVNANSDNLILIGPEGDFSTLEIELATKSGFEPVTLGNSRLRAETAGVVACSQMNSASIINQIAGEGL